MNINPCGVGKTHRSLSRGRYPSSVRRGKVCLSGLQRRPSKRADDEAGQLFTRNLILTYKVINMKKTALLLLMMPLYVSVAHAYGHGHGGGHSSGHSSSHGSAHSSGSHPSSHSEGHSSSGHASGVHESERHTTTRPGTYYMTHHYHSHPCDAGEDCSVPSGGCN